EALLRALAVLEDGARPEEPEGDDHALARVEAKLDLLTVLVAGLVRQEDADPVCRLAWSARGARLELPEAPAEATGLFRVRPADWMPSPMVLLASELSRITRAYGVLCSLRFDPMPPSL